MSQAVFNFLEEKRGQEWNEVNENQHKTHRKSEKWKWPALKGQ